MSKPITADDLPPHIRAMNAAALGVHAGILPITVGDSHTKADKNAERQLQKLCEQELSRRNVEYLHLSYRAREKKGWPDLTFAWEGKPYAVELKAADGKLSEDQEACLARMKDNGWIVMVLRSYAPFARIFRP